MSDLISRQAAIEKAELLFRDPPIIDAVFAHYNHGVEDALAIIKNLPSAQPERKKGKWVRNFDGNEWYWYCLNCKEKWYEEDLLMGGNDFPNYCPNCGSYNGGEQE